MSYRDVKLSPELQEFERINFVKFVVFTVMVKKKRRAYLHIRANIWEEATDNLRPSVLWDVMQHRLVVSCQTTLQDTRKFWFLSGKLHGVTFRMNFMTRFA